MTTLTKFNDKDLLRNIRTGVLNPMVDQTNENTLDVDTLKGRVSGVDKRLGFLEPEVNRNTTNLSALNRLAQGVAQQLSMAYDKSTLDVGQKHITFTSVGGVDKTLDLSPMFVDPIRTTISVKGPTESNYHEISRLDFQGNVTTSYDTTIPGSETATITIEPFKGAISGGDSQQINEIEIKGNTSGSTLSNKKLTINLPTGGGGTSNSMFIEPNPPQVGKNVFLGNTKQDAESQRDTYFNTGEGAADLATYDANVFKIILIEWDNGADDKLLQFQCRHNKSWVNPFHMDFSSFAISKHSIDELRDGNRVTVLESNTINDVKSVGTNGVEIFEMEGGRKLKLKRLQSQTVDDMTIITGGGQDVVFKTNQHWRGSYTSASEASTSIPTADRVVNKTAIITKNAQNEDALHIWDGTNWTEQNISDHSVISPDNHNFETLKGLKHGAHISFTKGTDGYHTVEALSPIFGKVSTSPEERIDKIEVSNKFAVLNNGTLRLPVISAMNSSAVELGQIKNIQQGENVTFDYDTNGVVTIKSAITPPIKVQQGSLGLEKTLTKITDPTSFTTLSDNGELSLHGVDLVDSSYATQGYIKSFKAGDNVTLTKDGSGILTIASTGGGSGGSDIKVTTGEGGAETSLTKIIDPSRFSTVDSDGVLTLHRIDSVGTGGVSQGQIKSLKSGDNITFKLDSDGVLQIDSFGGGGGTGGSIQAQVDGGTGYQDITKIEALKSPSTIENGILKLNPITYKKSNDEVVCGTGVRFIKAGVGIGFSEGDDAYTLEINNEGKLKGKVKNESGTTHLRQIDQINFVSDKVNGDFDSSDQGILTLDTRGFPAGASSFDELQTKFPVTDNAYRHGYVGNTKDMYFAHSESVGWKLHNYFGMADEVKSLNSRFPVTTSITSGTYDPDTYTNRIYYVTKEQCPIKNSEYKEYGVVKDIVADKTKRSQMFYGLETGNIWYRIMSPTTTTGGESDFLEWNLLNGLSEDYYSILTVPSISLKDTEKGEIDGTKALPWIIIQDPRCNVSVDAGDSQLFRVNKTGTYDITVCAHITSSADTSSEALSPGATYTYTLTNNTTGQMVGTPKSKTGVKVPPTTDFNSGMYPPVRMTFASVKMKAGDLYKLTVNHSRNRNLSKVYLDSFKNYLVIQPSTSNTKQGVVIADSLRTSLGGFSSKPGYEMHVEGAATRPTTVRVFGTVINDKLVTG